MATAIEHDPTQVLQSSEKRSESSAQGAQELFEGILADRPELSSLPQTLAQVIAIAQDDNASIGSMAKVIESDPGLATRVMRAANSPQFGQMREVTSIKHAAQTIGFRAVFSFALASSVYSLTEEISGVIPRTRFWRHSLETAVAARLLAPYMGGVYPDEAFVSGLLHDIGMLIYDTAFTARYEEIMHEVEAGGDLCDLEMREWGATHAAAGEFLLRQWNIPESIATAVGQHHISAKEVSSGQPSQLTLCVALANTLTRYRMFDRSGDEIARHERRSAISEKTALNSAQFVDIDEKLSEELIAQASYLQIEVGDSSAMLRDANRALYGQYLVSERLLRERREMQEEIVSARAAEEARRKLKAVSGTYHHYINNAMAGILGNLQLLEIKQQQGKIVDETDSLAQTLALIISMGEIVKETLKGIEELTNLETVRYHDELEILDLETILAKRKAEIEVLASKIGATNY
ncbi:HDOD domain-containing protein [Gemmatimonas aurantiaca]|nr:HDOD domain-containing protein [Gemmatimonas aurantiaca]